jgi:hypothetical protein
LVGLQSPQAVRTVKRLLQSAVQMQQAKENNAEPLIQSLSWWTCSKKAGEMLGKPWKTIRKSCAQPWKTIGKIWRNSIESHGTSCSEAMLRVIE